ncbi:type Z 30S ribosomal protein S14, partial [Dysosmobacter welbionis]
MGQVHLAGLQANGAVQRLGNRAEDDALDGRSAAPVVLKGLQDHVAAQLPGDELEGAGAHGVL